MARFEDILLLVCPDGFLRGPRTLAFHSLTHKATGRKAQSLAQCDPMNDLSIDTPFEWDQKSRVHYFATAAGVLTELSFVGQS